MPDSFPSALTSNCETLVFRNASVSSQAERQSTQHRAELWVNLLSLKKCTLRSPLCFFWTDTGASLFRCASSECLPCALSIIGP